MSTKKYESAASLNMQPEITRTSAADVSKDYESDQKFGTPYIVSRSNGTYSIMYESPHIPTDRYGNPVKGYREVVGDSPELTVDVLGEPVLDEAGKEQYFLPSKIVTEESLTDDNQRALAESYGVQYGQLRGIHPGENPPFKEYMNEQQARKVSDELLRVINQPHFVERSDGTLEAMYESPIPPVDEEGNVIKGYVEMVSATSEIVRDPRGVPVRGASGELQHFLPSKIVSEQALTPGAQQALALGHGKRYEDLMDIRVEDTTLLKEYFEKQVHRHLGRELLHLVNPDRYPEQVESKTEPTA